MAMTMDDDPMLRHLAGALFGIVNCCARGRCSADDALRIVEPTFNALVRISLKENSVLLSAHLGEEADTPPAIIAAA